MNAANTLTLLRVALFPVTLVVMFSDWPYHTFIAAGLVLIAWLSDALDGLLARRSNSVSKFGTYLDAATDKIFVLSILFGLARLDILPFWLPCTVLTRDLLINSLRSFASTEGVVVSARWWGKLKTTLTFPAAAGLIIGIPGSYPLMLIATLISVMSGFLYVVDNRQMLGTAWRGSNSP